MISQPEKAPYLLSKLIYSGCDSVEGSIMLLGILDRVSRRLLFLFLTFVLQVFVSQIALAVQIPLYIHDKKTPFSLSFPETTSAIRASFQREGEDLSDIYSDLPDEIDVQLRSALPETSNLFGTDSSTMISNTNIFIGSHLLRAARSISSALDRGTRIIKSREDPLYYSRIIPEVIPKIFEEDGCPYSSRFEGDVLVEPLHVRSVNADDLALPSLEEKAHVSGVASSRQGRITIRFKVYPNREALSRLVPKAIIEVVFQREERGISPLLVHIYNPLPELGALSTARYVCRELTSRFMNNSYTGYPGHCVEVSCQATDTWGYCMNQYRPMITSLSVGVGVSALSTVGGFHPLFTAASLLGVTGATYIQQKFVHDWAAQEEMVKAVVGYILKNAEQPPSPSIEVYGMLHGNPKDTVNAIARYRPTPVFNAQGQPYHEVLPAASGLRKRK